MNNELFIIKENNNIAKNTFKMVLKGYTGEIKKPGQFVNIKIDGFFLRRPISVCDWSDEELTLVYKTIGHGTEVLSGMKAGEKLDLLTGLGNGYDFNEAGERPVLIGGGAGIPPMYGLAKELLKSSKEKNVQVILGFNTKDEIFMVEDFKKLGCDTYVTTADGSCGTKGFVTDILKELDYTYSFACGPVPMLKAVDEITKTSGQYSFEERMGCGFGACMGCSCKTKNGIKRICKEGPVLKKEEIIW